MGSAGLAKVDESIGTFGSPVLNSKVDRPSVRPGHDPTKRDFHPGYLAIIVIVNLGGIEANHGVAIPHLPREQPRLLVEV